MTYMNQSGMSSELLCESRSKLSKTAKINAFDPWVIDEIVLLIWLCLVEIFRFGWSSMQLPTGIEG